MLLFLKISHISKTTFTIACFLMLFFGMLNHSSSFLYYGLTAIIFTYLIMLSEIWVVGKYNFESKETITANSNLVFEILLNLIVIFGFFAGVIKYEITSNIWVASVVYYALSGVIFSVTTNTPIRMGHSGWKIRKKL